MPPPADPVLAWPPPGFRHLFPAMPAAPEPPRTAAALQALRARMDALAGAMHATDWPTPEDRFDNPDIPAGYTYLLQFVAHDLVHTALPFWAVGMLGTETRDLATRRLRLETLYGGGPAACPFAYMAGPGGPAGGRSRVHLAPMAPLPGAPAGSAPPLRDIPRVAAPGGSQGLTEALVCDQRNDDNSNVSQMTVLFGAFHNAVVEALAERGTVPPAAHYDCAREAVTLVYRRVLKEDLLRRLLHARIHADYRDAGAAWFLDDGAGAGAMPLEFSHGAFRCGHAMVRNRYRINDGFTGHLNDMLGVTSGAGAAGMPITSDWTIRWSHFFDLGGPTVPNPSRLLRPKLSMGLLDRRFFGAMDGTGRIGLGYRDLLSAGLAGLRSVQALWDWIIAHRPPAYAGLSPLADVATRRDRVGAWLAAHGVAPEDAAPIAEEPPLPFYVLFEAMEEQDGRRLGALGSIIVAEVILGAILRDPLPCETGAGVDRRDVAASLARLSARWGDAGGAALAPLAQVADMPGLVRFAARAKGIGADTLPFV